MAAREGRFPADYVVLTVGFHATVLYPFPSDPLSLNNKINLCITGQK